MISVALTFETPDALRLFYDEQLSKGRAFVAGDAPVTERAQCELVLHEGGRVHRLFAEVVHVRDVDPGRGVGLQLTQRDPDAVSELRAFVEASARAPAFDPVSATPHEGPGEAEGEREHAPEETPEGLPDEEPGEDNGPRSVGTESVNDRVKNLSGAEQLKLAAAGTLAERTALERTYGPTVWETLLRNPRLTLPEVARIAKKASLPRPLVDLVAANPPWVASGEVQRALLANPRSSSVVVAKVLTAMSRHDLLLVPHQTAYPETVRAAAKKRLGR